MNTDNNTNSAPKTLAEAAYLQLRRDIISGKRAPGEKLRVEHLKDEYNVGAGTLREALALLVADALVVAQGQRGFRVAPISLADMEDITRTRALLETEALRQSIASGDDAWEGRLVAAFHQLSKAEERLGGQETAEVEEWEERNREFHEALIGASGSRWVNHFLAVLYRQSERYRHLAITTRAIPRDLHSEHTAIFKAALARDQKLASKLLNDHILLTLKSIRQLPAEALAPAESVTRG